MVYLRLNASAPIFVPGSNSGSNNNNNSDNNPAAAQYLETFSPLAAVIMNATENQMAVIAPAAADDTLMECSIDDSDDDDGLFDFVEVTNAGVAVVAQFFKKRAADVALEKAVQQPSEVSISRAKNRSNNAALVLLEKRLQEEKDVMNANANFLSALNKLIQKKVKKLYRKLNKKARTITADAYFTAALEESQQIVAATSARKPASFPSESSIVRSVNGASSTPAESSCTTNMESAAFDGDAHCALDPLVTLAVCQTRPGTESSHPRPNGNALSRPNSPSTPSKAPGAVGLATGDDFPAV
jgi:hypothetical protein